MRAFSQLALLCLVALLPFAAPGQQGPPKPQPTYRDVAYGPYLENRLDFWQAETAGPAPLVIFIHGGGFRSGSKRSINARTFRRLLAAGIHMASVEYRFVQVKPLPAAHEDCKRALQFLRSKAAEWKIDPRRIGAFGGSAGAQLAMWLAFHDDMAEPRSPDPIARQSTRLAAVATTGGQTTMDMDWWFEHVPGYDRPHRDPMELYGTRDPEKIRRIVADISALNLVSPDDPPIFMAYRMAPDDPVPSDPKRARGWKVHHVVFGLALKKKMDALGVEADLRYPGARSRYASIADFFLAKLNP